MERSGPSIIYPAGMAGWRAVTQRAPPEKGTEVCVVHCAELFRGEATRAGGVRRTQVNPPPGAGPFQIYGVTSAGLSQAGNGLLADVFPLPHTPAKASW